MRHLINLSSSEISLFSLCYIVGEEMDIIFDLVPLAATNENIGPFNFGCTTASVMGVLAKVQRRIMLHMLSEKMWCI